MGNTLTQTSNDFTDIKNKNCSFISNVNKICAKFQNAGTAVKAKLFKSYCSSFYGCQTWSLNNKSTDKLVTCWNKSVRRLLNLPITSHTSLLSPLINADCFKSLHAQRVAKHISCGLSSQNAIVSYVFNRSSFLKTGFIGKNCKILYSYFNVSDFILKYHNKSVFKPMISVNFNISASDKAIVNTINELMDRNLDIPGFNMQERSEMIDLLSTM